MAVKTSKVWQRWHCELCGASGRINGDVDVQAGVLRIIAAHRRRSPACESFEHWKLGIEPIDETHEDSIALTKG